MICMLSQQIALSDNWPQWRGPERNGKIEAPAWPKTVSTDQLNQDWSIALEPSYSGPIVVGDTVFTTETIKKKWESVRALGRKTGKEKWQTQWEGAMSVPFFAKANGSWIRSTPAYDSGVLYVAGIRDVLVALDAEKGTLLWRKDFTQEMGSPLPSFGCVSSPLIHGDAVIVQAGGGVVSLDKSTGDVNWHSAKDGGGMYGSAFSSPTITTLAGSEQLVIQSRSELMGLNPSTGNVLWKQPVKAFRGMNILTPTFHKDLVITSAYGGKTHAFKVTKEGSDFNISEAWNFKAQGYMSSPILSDTHMFLHLRNQRIACIKLEDGSEAWTTSERFGKYWSMIANKDQIMALDEKGILYLVKMNTEKLEITDQRKLESNDTWAHLAITGDQVFVRSLNGLSSFRWNKNLTQVSN